MEKKIAVDEKKCVHCGLCVKDCMSYALQMSALKMPEYTENGVDRCLACQHCMSICPTGALSFGGLKPENSEPVGYGDSEELLRLIKSRRSVRDYKDADIPAEKIYKIKEMLAYPPTGGNEDCLRFSIVGTRTKMDEIRKVSYDKILESSNFTPIYKFLRDIFNSGEDIIYRGASSMVVVCVNEEKVVPGCETKDPVIALSYLELYAQSLGLGTLWNDLAVKIINQVPEVARLLQIPENYTIGYAMLLGIPDVKYKRTVQKETRNVTIL